MFSTRTKYLKESETDKKYCSQIFSSEIILSWENANLGAHPCLAQSAPKMGEMALKKFGIKDFEPLLPFSWI